MKREEFAALTEKNIVFLDGATGSMLQKAGMSPGICPEEWIIEHKDIMINLQKDYIKAGSDIIYAPTFTGNRIKLEEYGLADEIESINRELVKISKRAVKEAVKELEAEGIKGRHCYVAGDLTMTGQQLYPIGTLEFEELVDIYKEQLSYMYKEGIDLVVIETMMSLQECRAALLAVKETSDLPVMVTLSFEEDERTLFGTDPVTAIAVLESMGADAVGANCSSGPDRMIPVIEKMVSAARIPVIAKPNCGMPVLVDGRTSYSNTPEEFAEEALKLIKAGASVIGGCCGTDPKCISLIKKASAHVDNDKRIEHIKSVRDIAKAKKILTSERMSLDIASGEKFLIIGERINPTGKKALQAALKNKDFDSVITMAEEQVEYGADILDVNVGMNGIDEKEIMLKAIYELSGSVNLPLCIDTSSPDVMEAALRIYPGRALMNSICLDPNRTDRLLGIAKKYGAMFILLPLSEAGLPKDIDEKKDIIDTIVNKAKEYGIERECIVVDGLVATVGANKNAALETLETIRYCKNDLMLETVCGLSNISFGLPQRSYVNSAFMALAINAGLTMAIANPMQELLMNSMYAADMLMAKPDSDARYVERITVFNEDHKREPATENKGSSPDTGNTGHGGNTGNGGNTGRGSTSAKKEGAGTDESSPDICDDTVYENVLKGRKESIILSTKDALKRGLKPEEIINGALIPAINKVGELYEAGRYFLPQLMGSAEAMKNAMDYLEPMLGDKGAGESKGKVVIATVKGDIHDIGKNLVAIMLKNYGFTVYDLGKNVEAEEIIDAAEKYDADIIGLSALMTTTMMEMKNVIELARKRKVRAKIMIGGAVVTGDFANEIEADGYSADAKEAVSTAIKLINESKQ